MEKITIDGRTYSVDVSRDDDIGAPWEWSDGHGDVSDWCSRDKWPGERVLVSDRGLKRFYDWQSAIAKAKREGWGLSAPDLLILAQKLGRVPTAGDITAEAVRRDFEYLRQWCMGYWQLCVVTVTDDETGDCDSLGGVEDSDHSYIMETAQGMAEDLHRNYKIANRFADAMACGL